MGNWYWHWLGMGNSYLTDCDVLHLRKEAGMGFCIEELKGKKTKVNGVVRKEVWGGIYYYKERMQIDKINETYYSFLELIKEQKDIYSAYQKMQELYDAEEAMLRTDIEELVKYMLKHRMISIEGISAAEIAELATSYEPTDDSQFVLGVGENTPCAPIKVLIETTYHCNLKCVHCFADAEYCHGNKGDFLPGELSTGDWKRIIDTVSEAGVFDIFVSGGEAMMRRDIFEILEYIHEKGMGFFLLSNGTLIDDEKAKRLKEVGCLKVECNMDGATAQSYDAFRGVKGAFDRTVRGIKACIEHGIPLRCNVMETKKNIFELKDIVKTCHEIGVKEVCVVPLEDGGRGNSNKQELKFTPGEYENVKQFYDEVSEWVEREYGNEIYLITPRSVADHPLLVSNKNMPMCGAGRVHCTIDPYGNVKLCPTDRNTLKDENVNLLKRSLSDIWNHSSVLKQIREKDFLKCSSCINMECEYGCPVSRYRGIHGGIDIEQSCNFIGVKSSLA